MQQYPNWQDAVRKAQAAAKQVEAERKLKQQEAQRQAEIEAGRNLGLALAYFGIQAQPDGNWFELDDFQFMLNGNGDYSLVDESVWDEGQHAYVDTGRHVVRFVLRVSKAVPGTDSHDSDNLQYEWIYVNQVVEDDWSKVFTTFADALDAVEQRVAAQVRFLDDMRRERENQVAQEELGETDSLAEAIRSIVREEVSRQLNY